MPRNCKRSSQGNITASTELLQTYLYDKINKLAAPFLKGGGHEKSFLIHVLNG